MMHISLWHTLLYAVAIAAGCRIASRAYRKARRLDVSIELLVTVAIGGALLIGELTEAAAVGVLFILGEHLEARALRRTREALSSLMDLLPEKAVVLKDGVPIEVPPAEVRIGDVLLIRDGARVPVDGEVIKGRASINESPITGEFLPAEKVPGSMVYAGGLGLSGTLWIRAEQVGGETALARIVRRVEVAQEQKATIERFIDRFARWYTPAAGALAVLVLLFTHRMEAALTLLVIACPGALVISTPAAVMAGIGRAAQLGILIKGGAHLENASAISVLAFDKTGTLTEGRPRLTNIVPLKPSASDPEEAGAGWTSAQQDVLRWAAVAEAGSAHPVAQPIVREATMCGRLPCAEPSRTRAGRGVEASCASHSVAVGTLELMHEIEAAVPSTTASILQGFEHDGKTAVVAALDGRAIGVLAAADECRESARSMLEQVRAAGVNRIVMLTGDGRRTAEALARRLDIPEVHAGLLPATKLELVRRMQAQGGIVAMVGDGINDAPAMAAADVSIAMGSGAASLAIETADIVILKNDLRKIPDAIRIARATRRNMRQNIVIAMVTVAGLFVGVLTGSVHMATGMLIHELSVLMVTLNAVRLLRA